jgi:hypothetical protein
VLAPLEVPVVDDGAGVAAGAVLAPGETIGEAIGDAPGEAIGDGEGDGSAASATAAQTSTAIPAPTAANLFMVVLLVAVRVWRFAGRTHRRSHVHP